MELFGFGPHLMIEGTHANPECLSDLGLIHETLAQLPLELGMTVVLEPHVSMIEGLSALESGVTGVVMIAESHISIHTFPEQGYVCVDLFSAQEFDVQRAVAYVVERFEVGRYETHLTNRGKEFPKNLEQVSRIVRGEREYLEARLG